ncbi:Sm-like ribonucleo protein, partial [Microstroma glucosiphilum]
LPLVLVNAARGKGLLVELKSGETFNGLLIACDNFMNLTLREVYQTSSTGEEFWKLPECYIKGATIKYVRLADSTIDTVRQQEEQERRARQGGGGGGGQRGGHGGGDRG